MFEIAIDTTATQAALQAFAFRTFGNMQGAVKKTARTVMIRVLDRIPRPPSPAGQVYQRTGRLVAGYGPAARFLGLGGPSSNEGAYRWSFSPTGGISFSFINSVPYALGVEWAGPWSVPPNAPGGPQHYGEEHGKHAVLFSLLETEGELAKNISDAWKVSLP